MLATKLKRVGIKDEVNAHTCVLTISWWQQLNTSEAVNQLHSYKVKTQQLNHSAALTVELMQLTATLALSSCKQPLFGHSADCVS